MKANEAPEKIYMTPSFGEPDNVLLASFSKSHLNCHRDIEYIRTDTFIKRACDAYCKICKTPNCRSNECKWISDFKRHLEAI